MRHTLLAHGLLAACALASGCAGVVTGALGDEDDGDGEPPDGELVPPDCSDLGPPMVRRLTAVQLRRTLEAAFDDAAVPAGDVLTDPYVNGYQVDATSAVVRDLDSQQLMTYAEKVAAWAMREKRALLVACDTGAATCRRSFVADLGARLHREPLDDARVDAYLALLEGEPNFEAGAELVIAAMLQSPYFLYRRELGAPDPDDPDRRRLTPHELANNLSYTLTDGPPDAALLAAAREGRLATADDLAREALRLLTTPAAAATASRFVRGWLETDDLASRAKTDPAGLLTDAVRAAMLAETDAFFTGLLADGGTVGELFTAPAPAAPALASYYGTAPRAAGLLGQGSVLTRHALADSSSPVQRGKLVRERFLCETIPPPPPDVDPNLGDPGDTDTTRQRYEAHSVDPACRGCHGALDPVGFAFEHYDAFGRFRADENGVAIDATGTLAGTPDGDVPLDGLDSLGTYLGDAQSVEECLARNLSYFAYGLDGCNPQAIRAEAAAAGWTLSGLVLAIVRAPQFSARAAP